MISVFQLPKRKKQLVEIKKKILENQSSSRNSIGPSMSVLGSQSLFTSTLNEDITKYDFIGYSVRTYDEAARAMVRVGQIYFKSSRTSYISNI